MLHDPAAFLGSRVALAIKAVFPQLEGEQDAAISACKNPEHGDYQCNVAMPLAKKLGMKPRDVAVALVKALDVSPLAEAPTEANIAGPGFINIRLRRDGVAKLLEAMDTAHLGLPPVERAQRVVVDLMGVNLAKQMHVGHLRSPIIGDAIARALERLGHEVLRQNHVGDWGLPIAMVTARVMRLAKAGVLDLATLTLDQLDEAYKFAQAECQRDAAGLAAARKYGLGPKALAELEEQVEGATEAFALAKQALIRLQGGDAETVAVWKRIYEATMKVCVETCARLRVNVTDAHTAGESSYAGELAEIVDDMLARGVAEHDQGAVIVRLDKAELLPPGVEPIREPCLVRKTDGGFLYATTDIAGIRRRVQKLKATRLIYAIDMRQNLQMRQVYAASMRAGYAKIPETGEYAQMEHAGFGAVLGEDGRPFKTRSGESVKLSDLLDEMTARAAAAARQRSAALSEEDARVIGDVVGIAALKYADLSTDRTKDYTFSFDRMLAFEGNTGPYLLYALVRIKSIFRKAAEEGLMPAAGLKATAFAVPHAAEVALAMTLVRFPGAVQSVAGSAEPHRMCQYLYELATSFSSFFDQCPVLKAPDEATRAARLRLCDLTARVLADGLNVLGIPTLERM